MEPIVVKDFESALDAVKSLAQAEGREIQIPEEGNLVIRLTGEQWDGKLDYKVAEFITRLQREIVTMYNISTNAERRYSAKTIEENGLRVTVTLEKGSSLLTVNISNWLSAMPVEAQIISLVIVAGIFAAAYVLPRVKKTASEERLTLEKIKADVVKNTSYHESIEKIIETAFSRPQYMGYIASQMKPEDKLQINDIELTSDEAKSIYKTTASHDQEMLEKEFILDMDAEVIQRDYSKDTIAIQFEKRKRIFYLERLDDNDLQELNDELAKSKNGIVRKIPLRLTGIFKGGVFKRGYVDGVGEPREGALDIQSASLASASMEEDAEQENAE